MSMVLGEVHFVLMPRLAMSSSLWELGENSDFVEPVL